MPDIVFYQVSDMEVRVPPQIKAKEARLSPRYLLMMSADLDYNFTMRLPRFTAGDVQPIVGTRLLSLYMQLPL